MSDDNPYFTQIQHRFLWAVTWVLFLAGMLAWLVEGANRPLDPVVSPVAGVLHLLSL